MPKTKNAVPKHPLAVLAICIVLPAVSRVWGQSTAGPASDGEMADGKTVATDIDLRPQFNKLELPTRSQGSRGTCSVFTVTRAIEFALGRQQRLESRLSVEFLNWASNRVLRENHDGGFFSDLWKGFEKYGICDEEEMPYQQEFDRHRRPSEAAIAQAAQRKAANLTLHWIKPWDPKRGLTNRPVGCRQEDSRPRPAGLRRFSLAQTATMERKHAADGVARERPRRAQCAAGRLSR